MTLLCSYASYASYAVMQFCGSASLLPHTPYLIPHTLYLIPQTARHTSHNAGQCIMYCNHPATVLILKKETKFNIFRIIVSYVLELVMKTNN
jgi:hypothetical protein